MDVLPQADPIEAGAGTGRPPRQPTTPIKDRTVDESAPQHRAAGQPSPTDPQPHSVSGAFLGPRLDPDVERQVVELLAGSADPGPMPGPLEARISLALAEESRVRRGASGAVPPAPRRASSPDHDVLSPLIRQRQRPRPLFAAAAVAAAAAVVAVGGSALHLSKRPGDAAAVVAASSPTAPASTGARTVGATGPRIHIQLSTTDYDSTTIRAQARELLTSPRTPLREGAAESPSLGPIATQIGLAACLRALGVGSADAVSTDLATYAGEPAAIIVVTTDAATTAYAVQRSCTTDAPQVLLGATPVP